jgi:hypothetical protein
MLKAVLIALAALTAFDAVAWHGEYRIRSVQAVERVVEKVASLDWTSGPLV